MINVAIYAAAMATLVICIIRAYARAVQREEEIRRQDAERERRARERSRAEQEYHRMLNKAVTVNPNLNYRPPIGKPLPPDVRKDIAQYMNASLYTHADLNTEYINLPLPKHNSTATLTINTMASTDCIKPFSISDYLKEHEKELELKPRVCPQCGAPVRGKVCEYCGTQFR